ncbi:MAG TPA: hypothetical protein VIN60_08875 [Anaerolineales bacterium]
MAKKYFLFFLPVIFIAIGLMLILTASSSATLPNQASSTATAILTPIPTISVDTTSHAGTTDWITLMGVIIVLIVVIPVLFRRSTWMK